VGPGGGSRRRARRARQPRRTPGPVARSHRGAGSQGRRLRGSDRARLPAHPGGRQDRREDAARPRGRARADRRAVERAGPGGHTAPADVRRVFRAEDLTEHVAGRADENRRARGNMAAMAAKPGAVVFLAVLTPLACRPTGPIMSDAHFHGWPSKVRRNAAAEVVVVPAIGRVMEFRLLDAGSKPIFWSHPGIGPPLGPDENGWINFGGDKAWPAPQTAWASLVGKGWPPPATFDAVAHA